MANELTVQQAAAMLATLGDAVEYYRTEISQYRCEHNIESDEEALSNAPIIEWLYNPGGSDNIHSKTNSSAAEFTRIWNHKGSFLNEKKDVGWGKATAVTGRDVLFKTLTILKYGG